MLRKPVLVATDMEGCLVPEIWINFAQKTGIEELQLTTRDIPDYDELMRKRLEILTRHNLKIDDIKAVIATMDPLEGAGEYLSWLRQNGQVIILSDTFYEFAEPLMRKLDYPALFCHTLDINQQGEIVNYHLRTRDGKRGAVRGFQENGFSVISIGDSYNDTTMLTQADRGILFRAPDNVISEFPQFPVVREFSELRKQLEKYIFQT